MEENEKLITILSLRIYKRIIRETTFRPIEIEENFFNPKFYVWKFLFNEDIERILNEERLKKEELC